MDHNHTLPQHQQLECSPGAPASAKVCRRDQASNTPAGAANVGQEVFHSHIPSVTEAAPVVPASVGDLYCEGSTIFKPNLDHIGLKLKCINEFAIDPRVPVGTRLGALRVHEWILTREQLPDGQPNITRTDIRDDMSLHRKDVGKEKRGGAAPKRPSKVDLQYQGRPSSLILFPGAPITVINSRSGVLAKKSGLVREDHLVNSEVKSNYTAEELGFTPEVFHWLAVPGMANPSKPGNTSAPRNAPRRVQKRIRAQSLSTTASSEPSPRKKTKVNPPPSPPALNSNNGVDDIPAPAMASQAYLADYAATDAPHSQYPDLWNINTGAAPTPYPGAYNPANAIDGGVASARAYNAELHNVGLCNPLSMEYGLHEGQSVGWGMPNTCGGALCDLANPTGSVTHGLAFQYQGDDTSRDSYAYQSVYTGGQVGNQLSYDNTQYQAAYNGTHDFSGIGQQVMMPYMGPIDGNLAYPDDAYVGQSTGISGPAVDDAGFDWPIDQNGSTNLEAPVEYASDDSQLVDGTNQEDCFPEFLLPIEADTSDVAAGNVSDVLDVPSDTTTSPDANLEPTTVTTDTFTAAAATTADVPKAKDEEEPEYDFDFEAANYSLTF